MTEILLPCPFCGRPPHRNPFYAGRPDTAIRCLNPGCVQPWLYHESASVAARRWNRRVGEKTETGTEEAENA